MADLLGLQEGEERPGGAPILVQRGNLHRELASVSVAGLSFGSLPVVGLVGTVCTGIGGSSRIAVRRVWITLRQSERGLRAARLHRRMTLEDLGEDVQDSYGDLGDEQAVALDRETRNELAMLQVALDPEDADELFRRGIHMLFQTAVETGNLDFHLRRGYDVTYDEYLSGMTFDEMTGGSFPQSGSDDERRYQF